MLGTCLTAVPSLEVEELPRMSNDRWLRFGDFPDGEYAADDLGSVFAYPRRFSLPTCLGSRGPPSDPRAARRGECLHTSRLGCPAYHAEMARLGEQARAQARTAELLAQWRVSQGEPYRRPLGSYYDDDEPASTSRPIVPTASCAPSAFHHAQ